MEERAGKIIHYYDKIGVGIVRLGAGLKVGDMIHVKGKISDFEQSVGSMQVEHDKIDEAKKGDEVAVKLNEPAKEGDIVYMKS